MAINCVHLDDRVKSASPNWLFIERVGNRITHHRIKGPRTLPEAIDIAVERQLIDADTFGAVDADATWAQVA